MLLHDKYNNDLIINRQYHSIFLNAVYLFLSTFSSNLHYAALQRSYFLFTIGLHL